MTPDITPDVTPDITPDVTPDTTPDIKPDVASDKGSSDGAQDTGADKGGTTPPDPEPTGCCAVAGGLPEAGPVMVLVLAVLGWVRRRNKK